MEIWVMAVLMERVDIAIVREIWDKSITMERSDLLCDCHVLSAE